MSRLVEELKNDHNVIVEMLMEVSKLGVSSKEGKDKLISAKLGLLSHLKKEDESLYPVLKKASETDPALKQTLELFVRDMEVTSKAVMQFFDKYSSGSAGTDFAKACGALFSDLKMRIWKEENILYAKYDELSK